MAGEPLVSQVNVQLHPKGAVGYDSKTKKLHSPTSPFFFPFN